MEHYDVIIIGTGAGGGTLAHRLAPSGKRILLLERGGYLPREPENWDSHEVFNNDRYLSGEEWIDKDGAAVQAAPAVLRRRQHEVLRRDPVPAARARLRRGPPLRRHLARVAARRTRTSSRTTRRPSGSTSSTGRAGEDPTEPPALGRRSRTRRSRTSRASSSSTTTSSAPAISPFHLPVGVDLNESDPEAGRCVRCDRFDGFPCLDRRQGRRPRAAACGRRSSTPNVTLRTHAQVERLETDADGRSVTAVVVDRTRRRGALQRRRRRRLLRRGELGGAAAALGLRAAPARARERLRPGRPQLHGPHQLGRDRDLADAERDEVPEDARRQRLLLGRRRLRPAARAHPDARQERPQHPARRRAVVRPGPRARLHGQARDRLLADHRGPAAPRQPRHGRPRRAHPPRQDVPQRGGAPAAAAPSSRACSATSAATRASRARRSSTSGSRSPASRTSAAPCASARTRRRRRSTSTAAPTTSTTSTSSTRASSRRRAR